MNNNNNNNNNNNEYFNSSNLLFKLSTPFQCFHHDLEYNNKIINMTKNKTNDLFNFNQPYQAQSFQELLPFKSKITTNNNLIVNKNRNHPYNKSTIITTTNSSRIDLESKPFVNNNNNNSQQTSSTNSSSNAILAHLKSLSPNFKSIFIRPKTHKPIDASCLFNKSKIHNKNVLSSMESSSIRSKNSPSFQTNLLPRIELKELRFNSSIDDILKKFTTEDDVIRRTIINVTSSSTSNTTKKSTTTTTTTTINNKDKSSFITGIHSSDESNDSSRRSNSITNLQSHLKSSHTYTTHNNDLLLDSINNKSKWTCMICLSKHSTRLDVCSICGSLKLSSITTLKNMQEMTSPSSTTSSSSSSSSSSNTTTTTSNNLANSLKKKQHRSLPPISSSTPSSSPSTKLFSSYLINELGLKHKLQQPSLTAITTSLQSSEDESNLLLNSNSKKINPYNKKWSCLHCNYQNDNLKIVCLNCRWAKTMPPSSSSLKTNKTNDLIDSPIKRLKRQSLTLDKEQLTVDLTDKNNNIYCSSCKSPVQAKINLSPTKDVIEIQSTPIEKSTNIESTTTGGFFLNNKSTLSNSTEKKWNCTTCLVANSESSDKCVCCMTSKPGQLNEIKSITQSASKWTCDTCLVQNEADKTSCVCCMTPKPGATITTKSSSTIPKLPELTTNLLLSTTATPSSSIKIGAPTNNTAPVKFDSVFKLPVNTDQQQQSTANTNKTFSFGLINSQSIETTTTTDKSNDLKKTHTYNFTQDINNIPFSQKTAFSLTNPSLSNQTTTFPSFGTSNLNKTEIPTFTNTSMTNSNNFFTPKTDTTTSTTNLPTLNFFNTKPSDMVAPNVTLTNSTTNLFGQPSSSTTTFSNTANLFSTKPNFSSFHTNQETNNAPIFGNLNPTTTTTTNPTTTSIQSFPLFDFKSTAPTTTSFPSLNNNNSQSKGFQFTPFNNNNSSDQSNNLATSSFMPSLNPIINFVANPNAIIFSGNNETGMNTPNEMSSQRRYRKAIRKNR